MSHCKFLGIVIDENLTWKHHIAEINKKVSRALFTIRQLKFTLPKESLRTLYFSLIHPHLVYGILAWGNATLSVLRKIEIVQKRALRTIHGKHFKSHTDPLFKQSGIVKISDLHLLEIMLFMHDYLSNKLPISFRNIFSLITDDRAYLTRQCGLFMVPKTRSRFVDKLPLYYFPILWNRHCHRVNTQVSRGCFKWSLKRSFLASYHDTVSCNNPGCHECCLMINAS